MTRILVTGGAGFIGSNYLHYKLHRAGTPPGCCPDFGRYAGTHEDVEILNLDAFTYAADQRNLAGIDDHHRTVRVDIRDAAAVEAAFRKFQPETVVHFAAESHVDRSIDDGTVFTQTNVVGTQILLDAARRHDVEAFLHVGTDEVYGSVDEGSWPEGTPLDPSSPYSASKAGSDLLALAHHHTYGTPVTVTRCTNNYGPRQHAEKMVPKLITMASQGKPMPVYGDGMQVRDWLYVKDHATAIDTILAQKAWGEVFHIAGQDERPNLDVMGDILDHLGASHDLLEHVEDRLGHDRRYSIDDSKLRALGWVPSTNFEQGLPDTVDWVLGNA